MKGRGKIHKSSIARIAPDYGGGRGGLRSGVVVVIVGDGKEMHQIS